MRTGNLPVSDASFKDPLCRKQRTRRDRFQLSNFVHSGDLRERFLKFWFKKTALKRHSDIVQETIVIVAAFCKGFLWLSYW